MKALLLVITLIMAVTPALGAPPDADQTGTQSAADQRQIAVRVTAVPGSSSNESQSGLSQPGSLEGELAAVGNRLNTQMLSHADRFKAFFAEEGRRFTGDLTDQAGRIGQALTRHFERMFASLFEELTQFWVSIPSRMTNLREESLLRLERMGQTTGDRLHELFSGMDNRLKEMNQRKG